VPTLALFRLKTVALAVGVVVILVDFERLGVHKIVDLVASGVDGVVVVVVAAAAAVVVVAVAVAVAAVVTNLLVVAFEGTGV